MRGRDRPAAAWPRGSPHVLSVDRDSDEIAARTQDWLAGRDPTVTGLSPETDPAIATKDRASLVR